jgi:hypothetical protein
MIWISKKERNKYSFFPEMEICKMGRWKIRTTKFPGSGKIHFRKFFPGLTGPNSTPPIYDRVANWRKNSIHFILHLSDWDVGTNSIVFIVHWSHKNGAPPKHRVLEHQQLKNRFLKHWLSRTSIVKNIDNNYIDY